ncbi:MAG TPA: pyridoxal phosphate-dependent aminotransferase [Polyangiaceae bacterium]|nr:pyridoxal phosphate-dependent aminotransferase [Polyangiaceae bacterium]
MKHPRLGNRMRFLVQSEIRHMTIECTRVSGINMSQGVCDTPVPEVVRRAAQAAIDEGVNTYTRYDGLPGLRAAIAKRLRERNGIPVTGEGDLVVTSGSSSAFYGACLAILDPGDDVVLFEPYYGYHAQTLTAVGVEARFVPMRPPEWSFDPAELERAVGPRTRAIVVNTPVNPCGKVFEERELEAIADVAERHDLFVITDEIYEHFVFDGRTHTSPGSLPRLRDRTITIGGFSKTFSITGWRIGFSAGPPAYLERLGYINDLVYICAPAPLQQGVARALEVLPPSFYTDLSAEYQAKRDTFCAALSKAGLPPHVPQGAYYVLADLSRLPGETSKDRVMHLLAEARVAAVPGSAFYSGSDGDHLARFCFAKTKEDLAEACRRLGRLS